MSTLRGPPLRAWDLFVEPGDPLDGPALQGLMHRDPAAPQVRGDARFVPPFAVQPDERQPALGRIADPLIRREAPHRGGCHRLLGEHALDRVVADAAPEAEVADGGDLAQIERRVLRLEVADRPADLVGQGVVLVALRRREEARHAVAVEGVRLPVEGPLGAPVSHARIAGGRPKRATG
jgi:hypothetical protein